VSEPRRYTQEEAERILRLAADQDPEGISRPRLVEMAAELGVSPEQVAAAEDELRTQERERQQLRIRRLRDLRERATLYVIGTGALVAADILLNRTVTWSYWLILVWGIALGGRAARVYLSSPERREREYRRWKDDRARHPLSDEYRRALDEIFTRFPGQKLQAVREMRDRFGLDLREAKDVVDRYDELYPNAFLG
jgi:hypothetical protein